MKLLKNKNIAIVGGGPGGLTLAKLLQKNGAEVNVYERDLNRNARMQGATLDLHEESGLKALAAAGLMDAFKKNFRPGAEQMRVLNKNAEIIFEDHPKAVDEISRPEIDRGPLQEILLDFLEPGTVVWNRHFVSLSVQQESWKLKFKNGQSALADIVIAADGANSKLRSYITPIKPFYSGITVVEGSVYHSETAAPKIHRLLNGGKIFALGDSKTLIVSSKGDGSLVFYTSYKKDANWIDDVGIDFSDRMQVLDWYKKEYEGWNPIFEELFENAQLPFVTRVINCMPFDQHWESLPNLTMLGDAAHLMPPFAGEGVNMAMLDALELCECLCSGDFTNTQAAISSYETQMRKRASDAARDSLESSDALHSPEAIDFLVQVIS